MASDGKVNCEKCAKIINIRAGKPINCDGDCNFTFHSSCVGISAKKYDEIIKSSDAFWFCDTCKRKRNNRRSTVMDQGANKTPVNKQHTQSLESDQMDIKTVYSMFKDLQKDIAELKQEVSTYKDIAQKLSHENICLRNENDILKSKINNVEYNVESFKQQNINSNVLLCGLPQTENEDLSTICTSLAAALEVEFQLNDVEDVYRKHISGTISSGLPAPIVIKFKNNKIKTAVMAAKKTHKINCDALGNNFEKRPLYISEQLTRHKQYIYKCARDKKRENIIKYAWSRNGEIFVRKTESSPIIKIKHQHDLDELQEL